MVRNQLQGRSGKVVFIWAAIWPTFIALILRNKGREDMGDHWAVSAIGRMGNIEKERTYRRKAKRGRKKEEYKCKMPNTY